MLFNASYSNMWKKNLQCLFFISIKNVETFVWHFKNPINPFVKVRATKYILLPGQIFKTYVSCYVTDC